MNNFSQIYFKLILEQTLNNNNQFLEIPNPFKNLLIKLKEAMLKAIDASVDKLKQINQQVNYWRDKILNAWRQLESSLTDSEKNSINDVLIKLISNYTNYMHGINTGY